MNRTFAQGMRKFDVKKILNISKNAQPSIAIMETPEDLLVKMEGDKNVVISTMLLTNGNIIGQHKRMRSFSTLVSRDSY